MGRKRKQGNMTPQKANNHSIEDLKESEGDESSVAVVKRMIRMFNELKEDIKKTNSMNNMD
jgi:hypothetical protein